jgi:hypothetical protein
MEDVFGSADILVCADTGSLQGLGAELLIFV